jgi:four helix bundle protein
MNHKDLDAWNKAMELVILTYKSTNEYPDHEKYGIVSQIRRAATSIATNIAEGAARNHDKEFIQFLYISLGSLSEIETLFLLSKELGYINQVNTETIIRNLTNVRMLILGLIKYLKTKKN